VGFISTVSDPGTGRQGCNSFFSKIHAKDKKIPVPANTVYFEKIFLRPPYLIGKFFDNYTRFLKENVL